MQIDVPPWEQQRDEPAPGRCSLWQRKFVNGNEWQARCLCGWMGDVTAGVQSSREAAWQHAGTCSETLNR